MRIRKIFPNLPQIRNICQHHFLPCLTLPQKFPGDLNFRRSCSNQSLDLFLDLRHLTKSEIRFANPETNLNSNTKNNLNPSPNPYYIIRSNVGPPFFLTSTKNRIKNINPIKSHGGIFTRPL